MTIPVGPPDASGDDVESSPWHANQLGLTVHKPADDTNAGVISLARAAEDAMAKAEASPHGKGTHVLWNGPYQRLVVIALKAGAALAEHASPPAASLQGIVGTARLTAGPEKAWPVGPGDIVPIPPERHAVDCAEDCAFLLTVSLDPKP